MEVAIVILGTLLNIAVSAAQSNIHNTCEYSDKAIPYLEVDELPKFQSENCSTALEYIYSKIQYPSEIDVQGKVIVSFVVTKCGKIEKIKIEKKLCNECDDEVQKALLAMPKWKAGKKDGKLVDTWLILPIDFKLE